VANDNLGIHIPEDESPMKIVRDENGVIEYCNHGTIISIEDWARAAKHLSEWAARQSVCKECSHSRAGSAFFINPPQARAIPVDSDYKQVRVLFLCSVCNNRYNLTHEYKVITIRIDGKEVLVPIFASRETDPELEVILSNDV